MDKKVVIPELLRKVATEDCESSFRSFFDLLYPRLYEVALYYTNHQRLAEEIVSDVFLKVWIKRQQLGKIKDIKSYLFIAVKRQSLNSLRNKRLGAFNDIRDQNNSYRIDDQNPESILMSQEMLREVSKSIQNLPEKCRLVFKLVKEENLKYREVAHLLQISEKTVEMHVGNALKKIRQDIKRFNHEPHFAKSAVKGVFLGLAAFLSSVV